MHSSAAAAGPPEPEWVICAGCGAMIYVKRFARNLKVCPECGHHHRLSAAERVDQLFDLGTVQMHDIPASSTDVLAFVDSQPYPDRLARARHRTGLREGVLVVSGEIEGLRLVAAVMDFGFLGGSLGAAVGELITEAANLALQGGVPLLIVTASGGARMQEGPIALMQMAKTSQAIARLEEAGILTVSLISDPTYGGVAASFATQCSVIIAEPAARLGFAGRRVIEQTIGHELPADFQSAELLLARGFIDTIKARPMLRATLRRLLAVRDQREAGASTAPAGDVLVRDPGQLGRADPWRAVQYARDLRRPTTLDYIGRMFHDFEELRGDRVGGDCPAIVAGVARLGGRPMMVIGHQRGHTAHEVAVHHYGMPSPAGYRKAARLMRMAAVLGLPIVTLVDTPGAHPGAEAEERGQAQAIAQCIQLMTMLPVPVITVIIGEGGSGGALALGVANEVLISEHAVYSVISPEGCASILWGNPAMAPRAAAALRLDARSLLELNVVDGVIREPEGGSQADHQEAARRAALVLDASLHRLAGLTPGELVRARRQRFQSFGAAQQARLGAGQ